MGLSVQDLAKIDRLLDTAGATVEALAELRRLFPKLSVTRCDASDLDAEMPFREYGRFDLYLVDGANHCWQLTTSPDRATGIVLVAHKTAA
jgi:hypothetical protein